jgi:hypothetical protein
MLWSGQVGQFLRYSACNQAQDNRRERTEVAAQGNILSK